MRKQEHRRVKSQREYRPRAESRDLVNEFYCAIEQDSSEASLDALEKSLYEEGFTVRELAEARSVAWALFSKHQYV